MAVIINEKKVIQNWFNSPCMPPPACFFNRMLIFVVGQKVVIQRHIGKIDKQHGRPAKTIL